MSAHVRMWKRRAYRVLDDLDDGRFVVESWRIGVAVSVLGVPVVEEEDGSMVDEHDGEFVAVVMVGDDAVHLVERDDLRAIERGAYCSCCGQVGCAWGIEQEDSE